MRWAALIPFLTLAASSFAADWTEYRIGPLYVISDAGDGAARDRLTEMEQIRWVLGERLGKADLEAVWPIQLVLFNNRADADRYRVDGGGFFAGGSAMISVAHDDEAATPAWRAEIVRLLIESNSSRMGQALETALADLLSTIEVEDATRVRIGAPLPAGTLSAERQLEWAKLHMIAATSEFAGRFRIYLNNLQQGGDRDLAARNTFGIRAAELDRRMTAYAEAGQFEPFPVFGESIDPRIAFYERRLEEAEVEALMAELERGGESYDPESPRGLLSRGLEPPGDSLLVRRAAARNPLWAEPHYQLSLMETSPSAKAERLEKAVELEPRVLRYWVALAEAYVAGENYREASQTWVRAERAATSDDDRSMLRDRRREIEDRRVEADLAAANAAREERERHIREVQESSDARIQAALDAANEANREESGIDLRESEAVAFEEGFGGVETVRGSLVLVGCIDGWLRLAIQQTGGALAVVRMFPPEGVSADPDQVAAPTEETPGVVVADAEADPDDDTAAPVEPPSRSLAEVFACGAPNPAPYIEVVHDGVADERLGTEGTAQTYEIR